MSELFLFTVFVLVNIIKETGLQIFYRFLDNATSGLGVHFENGFCFDVEIHLSVTGWPQPGENVFSKVREKSQNFVIGQRN